MALIEQAGDTQTAVIGTEHVLATRSDGKTYVLVVDTSNMVNGDVVELRLKTKVRDGSTSKGAYFGLFANAQSADEVIKYSDPVPANIELVATLTQTDGTGRDFEWALLSLD